MHKAVATPVGVAIVLQKKVEKNLLSYLDIVDHRVRTLEQIFAIVRI